MGRKVTHGSRNLGSRETGHSKGKHLDPLDNKTSRGLESDDVSGGLESDDVPKSCRTKEEISRAVRKELKPVKSDLTEVKKELKLLNSRLADLFRSRNLDTVKGKKVQPICSSVKDDDEFQREVREKSEHPSSPFVQPVRSSSKRRKRDEGRNWQLQFEKALPSSIYTEEKLTIDVNLVDANTGDIVKSGPESSVKVEAVVLKGDSEIGSYDNWTWEGFEKSIEKEREGKAPLLSGRFVNLNRGTGVLDDVRFTDNSSWTRSKTFRLGLRVSPEYHEVIREAITEPIRVKENRGQSNKKHDELAPGDEVWRIKTIGRNGPFHKNLSKEGICNVGQFFRLLNTESDRMKIILGTTMTQKKWEKLRGLAKTFLLNGNPHVSLDNEDDHQNGRQLTDHTADRVHCAADEFPLKQENHEDTIGEASSSLQYQVSENPAPARRNMAPSTCAAPVGPEAPPANVNSTAEGHNDVIASPSPVQSQNTYFGNPMTSPANGSVPLAPRPPIPTCCLGAPFSTGDNTITTFGQSQNFTSQSTMPSHVIGSPSQRDYTLNGNIPPSGLPHDSLLSFPNGHNGLAASPSPVQPQNTYLGNPMKSPANVSVLAPHLPIPTYCSSAPFSIGNNTITTVGQSEDFASQPTVPSRVISSPSQMDYTWNGNVPIFEPHRDSLLSFRKGHNGAADLPLPGLLQNTNCEDTMAFPVDENAPPTERQPISADPLSGLFSQGDIRIDSFGPPIRSPDIHSQMFNHSPIAPCPERAYAMEELHVDFDAMDSLWSDLP